MTKKSRRPARFRAGHMKDRWTELLERANLSRERLAGSELAASGQAWRLWAACLAATVDVIKAADQTYAGTLAEVAGIDRTDAGRLLRRFDELGVFRWEAAPRASRVISELSLPQLPRDVMPQPARGAVRDASARTISSDPHHFVMPQPALPINTSMSVEPHHSTLDIATGEQHSPLIAAPDQSVESFEAGTRSREESEARPAPEPIDPERLAAEIEAALAGDEAEPDPVLARTLAHFAEAPGSFHGDERTGDTTGDDEAAQVRWAGANPSKTRQRRQRERG